MKVFYYDEIDSTNTEAKRMIENGLDEPALIIAKHQTAGRGRQGKSFYSPNESGIYMTVVLWPNCDMDEAVTLTTTVAVIAAQSINQIYGITPGIKWVNDLYLDNRKICGILCEAVNDYENKLLKAVIIGIGINMDTSSFPDDIKGIAGSLLNCINQTPTNKIERDKQIVSTDAKNIASSNNTAIYNFDLDFDNIHILNDYKYRDLVLCITSSLYHKIPCSFSDFLSFYKENSIVIGKNIYFIENGKSTEGQVIDIDNEGGLVVELCDGGQTILRSGEISIKVK